MLILEFVWWNHFFTKNKNWPKFCATRSALSCFHNICQNVFPNYKEMIRVKVSIYYEKLVKTQNTESVKSGFLWKLEKLSIFYNYFIQKMNNDSFCVTQPTPQRQIKFVSTLSINVKIILIRSWKMKQSPTSDFQSCRKLIQHRCPTLKQRWNNVDRTLSRHCLNVVSARVKDISKTVRLVVSTDL